MSGTPTLPAQQAIDVREALQSMVDAFTSDTGEVERRLAIKDARAALVSGATQPSEPTDPMNYKGMFLDAVNALAQIDALLGLPEDGCNDPQMTVSALADYIAGTKDAVPLTLAHDPKMLPSNQYLLKYLCKRTGIELGTDRIDVALKKADAALATPPTVEPLTAPSDRVMTWQERAEHEDPDGNPKHWPISFKAVHMEAEITELRAALAATAAPTESSRAGVATQHPADGGAK